MKTTKRKRSSAAGKAQPGVVASGVEAAAAEVTQAVEVAVEPAAVVIEAVAAAPAASEPAAQIEPVIVLAANCSVKDAAALKSSLSAVVKESAAVTLDTTAVERIDTATMQLLCAFVRDRSGRNQPVTWRGASQALQDAARLLGVRALLGFEEADGVAA